MTRIDVTVVDDNEVDRYIVKRKLAKAEGFGEVTEMAAGDHFLDGLQADPFLTGLGPPPRLILMDINMPRLDGFETVSRMQELVADRDHGAPVVVMMFTSSDNPNDKAKAQSLPLVKGYVCKPFDDDGIERIRAIYSELWRALPQISGPEAGRSPPP